MALKMSAEEVEHLIDGVFPQVAGSYRIDRLQDGEIVVRQPVDQSHLRPGGTVSGPTMFALADVSVYMLVLAMIGPQALAVTTNCSIDFMRKPAEGADLIARCRMLKLGKALAVGDVLIFSDGDERPVARASLTYSIPPRRPDSTVPA